MVMSSLMNESSGSSVKVNVMVSVLRALSVSLLERPMVTVGAVVSILMLLVLVSTRTVLMSTLLPLASCSVAVLANKAFTLAVMPPTLSVSPAATV